MRSWSVVLVLALAACGGDDGGLTHPPVTVQVSLAPGAFALLGDTAVRGAIEFPAADANGAEYLVIGQLASPSEASLAFSLGADGGRSRLLMTPAGGSRFPANSRTVARPISVRPTILKDSTRKWSSHTSRRGWNSRVT